MGLISALLPHSPLPWVAVLSIDDRGGVAGELRARQLEMFLRNAPFVVVSTIAMCGASAAAFSGTQLEVIALLWFTVVATILCGIGALAMALRDGPEDRTVSGATFRRGALGAVVGVVLLNTLPLFVIFRHLGHDHLFIVALIQLAMIAAGVTLFAPVPLVGLAYAGTFLGFFAATLLALFQTGEIGAATFVLPFVLGMVLVRSILARAAANAAQVRQMADIQSRGDVIAMLLAEFEENSRDWLWEVDASGKVLHISGRFAQLLGLSVEDLTGRNLDELSRYLVDGNGFEPVIEAVRGRRTFRNVVCPVEIDDDLRWWALSGSPRYREDGSFQGYMGIGSDVTELRRSQDQIERMACCDGLTGLANRSVMRGELQAALDRARTTGGSCALMLVDLDRFKAVNDSFGHQTGDELLREVAQRLRAVAGAEATCARLGGDEFAIVLPGREAEAARELGEQMVERLSEPYDIRGSVLRIGACVGVAAGPGDGATIDELTRAADLALYAAKDGGRGLACRFESDMQQQAEEKRSVELALRGALRNNELSLVFQPIYNLATNEVRAFEALLRWHHPELGPIPPARFIPMAEEAGLMDNIGEWVIRSACAWASRWPEHIGVAVNLSPLQLVNQRLAGVVLNALASHGISPQRLELEITENVFLSDDEVTVTALAQLSALGVRLGLDDFGTGYSSLSYLRSILFSTIKIDRSFVRDAVDAGSQSAEIVRHIVSLANNLGMETVAEGAETGEELDAVRQLGCGNVQGFFTGRPMTPEDATALAARTAMAVAA